MDQVILIIYNLDGLSALNIFLISVVTPILGIALTDMSTITPHKY